MSFRLFSTHFGPLETSSCVNILLVFFLKKRRTDGRRASDRVVSVKLLRECHVAIKTSEDAAAQRWIQDGNRQWGKEKREKKERLITTKDMVSLCRRDHQLVKRQEEMDESTSWSCWFHFFFPFLLVSSVHMSFSYTNILYIFSSSPPFDWNYSCFFFGPVFLMATHAHALRHNWLDRRDPHLITWPQRKKEEEGEYIYLSAMPLSTWYVKSSVSIPP